jgi:methyltransferase (TIGR00027 family)
MGETMSGGRNVERTDDDTWDLATSVGATATMTAAGRARASRADHRLIDDPFAEPLVKAVGIDFFTRWATGELDAAAVDIPGAPWGMQQMTDLLTARTRYFDGFLSEAADAGIRQVVILASGLDSRAYRMSWPAGTVVFEIDQPEVLRFKASTLADLDAQPTAEVRPVLIDLRQDWPKALAAAGFDADLPSAWIVEGLLPFLPPEGQDRLLDDITALTANGSRLATEVAPVSGDPDGRESRESMAAMGAITQRWRDNGFDVELGQLGYAGARSDVFTYLGDRGWRSVRTPLRQLLADTGLPVQQVDGEKNFTDNYYCTSVKH